MAKYDNQNHPFIYDRTTGEKIPVSKEARDAYYGEAARIRMKELAHGRCVCPQSKVWAWLLWTFPSVRMARTP